MKFLNKTSFKRLAMELAVCGVVFYLITYLLLARNAPTHFIYFNF